MPKQVTSKKNIVAMASEVFLEYGYHATSIAMLSEACGIQKAHFYYYFKNKEAIMRAALLAKRKEFKLLFEAIIIKEANSKSILQSVLYEIEKLYINQKSSLIGNTILECSNTLVFNDVLIGFMEDLEELLYELYYLEFNGDIEQSKRKALLTIQDLQGGIMLMKLYSDPSYIKSAIERAMR